MGGRLSHNRKQKASKLRMPTDTAGKTAVTDSNKNVSDRTVDSDLQQPASLKKAGKYRTQWKASRTDGDTPRGNEIEEQTDGRLPSSPAEIRQSNVQAMRESRPTLTPERIAIVVKSWQAVQEDVPKVGYDMFVRLFEKYPDTKEAFLPFKTILPEDIRFSDELRQHGLRVINTVNEVLERINDQEAMVLHLHELGRKHVVFNAKPDYIDLIGPQFLFAIEPMLKGEWNAEMEEAWSDLFKFIGHVMRESMVM